LKRAVGRAVVELNMRVFHQDSDMMAEVVGIMPPNATNVTCTSATTPADEAWKLCSATQKAEFFAVIALVLGIGIWARREHLKKHAKHRNRNMERLAMPLIRPPAADVELKVKVSPPLPPGKLDWLLPAGRKSRGPGQWLALVLVLCAILVDAVLLVLRLLKRDMLDLPRWHVARRDPLGLVLQLAVQLPLGTPGAVLMSAFETMRGATSGFTVALPWVFATLPLWDDANAKAHQLCSGHSVTHARRALAGGSGGSVMGAVPREGGARLCDCLAPLKAGVLPIDRMMLALVGREVDNGADVNAVDKTGSSALHVAARLGLPLTVQALLDAGADSDLQNENGDTALHEAVRVSSKLQASWWGWSTDGSSATLAVATCLFFYVLFNAIWVAGYESDTELFLAIVLAIALGPLTTRLLKRSALAGLTRTAKALRDAPAADLGTINNNGKTAMMMGDEQHALLTPQPEWADVERAIGDAAAAPGAVTAAAPATPHPVLALLPQPVEHLRPLRLLDMLCGGDRVDDKEQLRRQQLIFDGLLVPFVRVAERRSLSSAEKKLLIAVCEATARGRAQHRIAFDALVGGAMATFEGDLSTAYTALGASAAGQALLALPATELLGGTAKAELSQRADIVMGRAAWLEPPSLAGAYQALVGAGALRGIEDMCLLLQSGRHRWFAGAHKAHFRDPEPWTFWLHVCALNSVARNEQLNAKFQDKVKAIAVTLGDAVHYKCAPIKKYERIVVKAEQYHSAGRLPETAAGAAEAVGRVIDIQRCSLEVDDAAAAMKAVALLKDATLAEHGMRPLRCKSGFNAVAESAGGYRDVKLNMLFQAKDVSGAMGRAVVEIQVILKEYLTVKKRMHAVYRLDRGDFDGTGVFVGSLLECAAVGDLAGVQQRLGEGAEIDTRGQGLCQTTTHRTPLAVAAEGGHLAVVQALLQRGAKADGDSGRNAARLASAGGHGDVVRLLAERGAPLELAESGGFAGFGFGDTALSCATREGHLGVVQTLLELGSKTLEEQESVRTKRRAASCTALLVICGLFVAASQGWI
jgi:hypothetical protein